MKCAVLKVGSRRRSAGMCLAFLAMICTAKGLWAQNGSNIFRNTDPSVGYVGSASCGTPGCHEEITRNYMQTPHGQSMAPANSATELKRAPQPITVFNEKNKRYYVVYQEGGNLYQSAYELDGNGKKTYSIAHKIDYVVGGERTGYSYLYRLNGWILQAPLSFYASSKSWELSPGYPADDVGFTRVMTTGCLVCHNGQPDPAGRHDGLYKEPPFRFGELGISCEACHGPGALHVKEMDSKNGTVLGSHEVDTSIVNPAKLSPRVADDICRECHQAGDSVALYPGKSYLDFRPGEPLADVMAIVKRPIKEEQRAEANRLEVSPPVRGSLEQPLWWKNSTLELSRCYQESHGKLTCSTCHSTHHLPAAGGEKAAYRAACLSCHTATSCTLKPDDHARVAVGDYCVECHMEKRAVAGIAHSNDTKHRIVRYPGQPLPEVAFEQPKADMPGLVWMNRPENEPDVRVPQLAQLDAYFTAARKDASLWPLWLKKLEETSKATPDDAKVLTYEGAIELAQRKNYARAAEDFSRALKLGSEEPTTFLNLATAMEGMGRGEDAEAVLVRGLAAYPYNGVIVARLALQYAMDGQSWRGRALISQYRKVFPEDPVVRATLAQIDAAGNTEAGVPMRGATLATPK